MVRDIRTIQGNRNELSPVARREHQKEKKRRGGETLRKEYHALERKIGKIVGGRWTVLNDEGKRIPGKSEGTHI